MIYFDLTDLVEFSRYSNNVSGIQRVIMNVAAEIEHEPETRFIYRNQIDGKFYEILTKFYPIKTFFPSNAKP